MRRPSAGSAEYLRKIQTAKELASAAFDRGGADAVHAELASLRRLDADPAVLAEVERVYHRAVKLEAQHARNRAAENDPEQMSHAQLHRLAQREARRQDDARERWREEEERRAREATRPALRPRATQQQLGLEGDSFRLLHSPGTVSSGRARARPSSSTQRGLFDAPEAPPPLPELIEVEAPSTRATKGKKASKASKRSSATADDVRRMEIARSAIYKKWLTALRTYERTIDKRAQNEVEQKAVWRARDKASDAYNWLSALPFTQDELAQEHLKIGALGPRAEQADESAREVRKALIQAEIDRIDEDARNEPHTRYVEGVGYVRGGRVIG